MVPELLQEESDGENLRKRCSTPDDIVTRHRLKRCSALFAESLTADTGALVAEAVTAELRVAGIAC